jgi:hypothetical protein
MRSAGYAFAKLTEQDEIKPALGSSNFSRQCRKLERNRFTKYYCNKCQKESAGSPVISYEDPNEE